MNSTRCSRLRSAAWNVVFKCSVRLALLFSLAGCGSNATSSGPSVVPGSDATVPDATLPEGGDAGHPGPQLPACLQGDAPPGCAQMRDWVCPDGWEPEKIGDAESWAHSICNPPSPPKCSTGQVAFPGEAMCHPLGTPCPSGDFLDEATIRSLAPGFAGKVSYVRLGATGTGTSTEPYGNPADALLASKAGDIIAFAPGNYQAGGPLPPGIAYVGSCVEKTSVTRPGTAEDEATVEFDANGGVRIANFRIVGDRPGVSAWDNKKPVSLHAIEISSALTAGILFGTKSTSGEISDVVVRDTRPSAKGDFGRGIDVYTKAPLKLSRVVLEGNHEVALNLAAGGAVVEASDLLVRDTVAPSTSSEFGGFGIVVATKDTATMRRALFERNEGAGINILGAGARVTAEDVVVRDTVPLPPRIGGFGLTLNEGARVTLTRALFERNARVGIAVASAGSHLTLVGGVVRDTVEPQTGEGGAATGIYLDESAEMDADRVVLQHNSVDGVMASNGALATVRDLVVVGCDGPQSDQLRRAFDVIQGAQVTVERGVIVRTQEAALVVGNTGSRMDVSDMLIQDTRSSFADGSAGRALDAHDGGFVRVSRAALVGNREVAVAVWDTGTLVELRDVLVTRTLPAACQDIPEGSPGSCVVGGVGLGAGTAVGAYESGSLKLQGFALRDSAMCGVQIARGGLVTASWGEVARNAIGANVQGTGLDLSQVTGPTIWFHDNGSNLDTLALAIPVPVAPTVAPGSP
jgi:hypothetical protein